MQARQIIRDNPPLIWSTQSYEALPIESVVEAVLNYGSWDELQKLISVIGVQEVAQIFDRLNNHPRSNLHKLTRNYFQHYFAKYA